MSIKIKSKKELIFDARNQRKGMIVIELIDFAFQPRTNKFKAIVANYLIVEQPSVNENEAPSTHLSEIETRTPVYDSETLDQLFNALNTPILIGDSYSAKTNALSQSALLIITQTDLCENGKTIYGGDPSDWEIFES